MAGQQFQYDDSGNTFFYFLTSFVGLIVIPATYYLWPRDQNAGESCRQQPVDTRRLRRPHRAAPFPPALAQPAAPGVIPPARPGLKSRRPPLAGPELGGVSLCASPGSSPPPSLSSSGVSLCTLSPIVLDAPCSLVLPLCLLCLQFYWVFFFTEGAGWDREDGNWEVREELAKEEAERAGSTLSPQATVFLPPQPSFPVAAVVTDVSGTV